MVPTSDNTVRLDELVSRFEVLVPRLEVLVPLFEQSAASRKSEYLDAAGVAERYGVSRAWVYRNADRLGGWKLGDGPRPRWRFDAAIVAEALTARPHPLTTPEPQRAKPRTRRPPSSKTPLLPIHGGH